MAAGDFENMKSGLEEFFAELDRFKDDREMFVLRPLDCGWTLEQLGRWIFVHGKSERTYREDLLWQDGVRHFATCSVCKRLAGVYMVLKPLVKSKTKIEDTLVSREKCPFL
jgi:hypothetical protein